MRVVLREAAHALHTVKRAATLVAVDRAELADAHRKIAVAVDLRLEHLDVTGTVHRLDPEPLSAVIKQQRPVHVLAVLLEMPRALIDLLVRDMWRVNERVAALVMQPAPPALELLADDRKVGKP